jgi:hypothetical protein
MGEEREQGKGGGGGKDHAEVERQDEVGNKEWEEVKRDGAGGVGWID